MDYEVAMEILKANGVSYLEPLFVGKMNDALNYDLKFDSTMPNILGLPAISGYQYQQVVVLNE